MLQAIAAILSKVSRGSSKRENIAPFGRIHQRWNVSNVPEGEADSTHQHPNTAGYLLRPAGH